MNSCSTRLIAAVCSTCICFIALPARSFDGFTAADLAGDCEGWRHAIVKGDQITNVKGDNIAGGRCQGFFLGVVQANSGMPHGTEARFCPPEGLTTLQAIKIFLKAADERPEDLHVPAYWLAQLAMRNAFPCP